MRVGVEINNVLRNTLLRIEQIYERWYVDTPVESDDEFEYGIISPVTTLDIKSHLKFKDDYVNRIVIATGKIATDINKGNDGWELCYDKNGIFIEDAHPIIELCRKKKDKRIYGVLGDPKRVSSRKERLIVNSIGEGGIWVCNSNGNIENGDYITSSDYLGYGEKQDDDVLHNYTVAKATINCDFELDSPYYNCIEIDGGLKIAFIGCTYHCG